MVTLEDAKRYISEVQGRAPAAGPQPVPMPSVTLDDARRYVKEKRVLRDSVPHVAPMPESAPMPEPAPAPAPASEPRRIPSTPNVGLSQSAGAIDVWGNADDLPADIRDQVRASAAPQAPPSSAPAPAQPSRMGYFDPSTGRYVKPDIEPAPAPSSFKRSLPAEAASSAGRFGPMAVKGAGGILRTIPEAPSAIAQTLTRMPFQNQLEEERQYEESLRIYNESKARAEAAGELFPHLPPMPPQGYIPQAARDLGIRVDPDNPFTQAGEAMERAGQFYMESDLLARDPAILSPTDPRWAKLPPGERARHLGQWLAGNVPEQAMQLAAQTGLAMATGGGSRLAQLGAFAAPTVILEGGGAFEEAYQAALARGESEEQARQTASMVTMGRAAVITPLEALPLEGIVRGARMGGRLAGAATGAATESLEETLQAPAGAAVDYLAGDGQAFEGIGREMVEGAILGGLVGGGAGAITGGGSAQPTGAGDQKGSPGGITTTPGVQQPDLGPPPPLPPVENELARAERRLGQIEAKLGDRLAGLPANTVQIKDPKSGRALMGWRDRGQWWVGEAGSDRVARVDDPGLVSMLEQAVPRRETPGQRKQSTEDLLTEAERRLDQLESREQRPKSTEELLAEAEQRLAEIEAKRARQPKPAAVDEVGAEEVPTATETATETVQEAPAGQRIERSAGHNGPLAYPDYESYREDTVEQLVQGGYTEVEAAADLAEAGIGNERQFNARREQELAEYVEEPVRPLVRQLWAEGKYPFASNAYGPGQKGVWYSDTPGAVNYDTAGFVPLEGAAPAEARGETEPARPDPAEPLAQAPQPAPSPARQAVERVATGLSAQAENAGRTVVVTSQDELPETYRRQAAQRGGGIIEALYDPASGTTYFVADHLESGAAEAGLPVEVYAAAKWYHEQGIHRGLRGAFERPRMRRLLADIYRSVGNRRMRETLDAAYGEAVDPGRVQNLLRREAAGGRLSAEESETLERALNQAEEYLAQIGEKVGRGEKLSAQEAGAWARFLELMRRALRRMGVNARLSRREIEKVALEAIGWTKAGERNQEQPSPQMNASINREASAAKAAPETNQEYAGQGRIVKENGRLASVYDDGGRELASRVGDLLRPIGDIRFALRKDGLKQVEWDFPYETEVGKSINGRLAKEFEIIRALCGDIVQPQMRPIPDDQGKPREALTVTPQDAMVALRQFVESEEFQKLVDPRIPLDRIAAERRIATKDLLVFLRNAKALRENYAALDRAPQNKNDVFILGDNGKAGAHVAFGLITCHPSSGCAVCYAAGDRYTGVLDRGIRNALLVLAKPQAFGRRLAEEVKIAHPDKNALPFFRLLGSGDITTRQQVDAFNELSRNLDRPIHIFSRHHDLLGELKSSQSAPFIRMASVDGQLVKTYGLDALIRDRRSKGLLPAYLLSSEDEIADVKALYDNHSLALVLTANKDLYSQLVERHPELAGAACPCDAGLRPFNLSCLECSLSRLGCFMFAQELMVDANGNHWVSGDPNMPEAVVPALQFPSGRQAAKAWALLTQALTRKSIENAKGEISKFFKPIRQAYDAKNGNGSFSRLTLEQKMRLKDQWRGKKLSNIILKDLRWTDDAVTTQDPLAAEIYIKVLENALESSSQSGEYAIPGAGTIPPVTYRGAERLGGQDEQDVLARQRAAVNPQQALDRRRRQQEQGSRPQDVRPFVGGEEVEFDPQDVGDDVHYSIRTAPPPVKTIKGYKLLRVKRGKKNQAQLFPLYMDKHKPTVTGVWLDADFGKGSMAPRPGWHLADLPVARHIGKKNKQTGVIDRQHPFTVWTEVEVSADVDWQPEANRRAQRRKDGSLNPKTAEIRDQLPKDGYYRYKTNRAMEGEWIIAGAMKINRVLDDAEVDDILRAAGVNPMPREGGPIDLERWGIKPGAQFSMRTPDSLRARQTQSPEFKAWFGDSKVVDENGEPLVVYHGTGANFTKFVRDQIGNGADNGRLGDWGDGFYFTADPETGSGYAEASESGSSNVMPVYLSIRNPITVKEIMQDRELLGALEDPYPGETVVKYLEDKGYDGIMLDDKSEIVAFRPTQIKSATGNVGSFDPENPDIRFSAKRQANIAIAKDRVNDPRLPKNATPEQIALHNTKAIVKQLLWDNEQLDDDVLYGMKGNQIEDLDKYEIEPRMERSGERRTLQEIHDEQLEFAQDDPQGVAIKNFKAPSDVFEWAKKVAGVTQDLDEAGYVLPDGTMLDLSGAKWGGMRGRRDMDHRELIGKLPLADNLSGTEGMREFQKLGAVRIDAHAGMVDLETKPTGAQLGIIRQLLEEHGEGYIDLNDGGRRAHLEPTGRGGVVKAIGQIRRFYEGQDIDSGARFSMKTPAEPAPVEEPEEDPTLVSVRNAYTERRRAELGMDPRVKPERRRDQQVLDEAQAEMQRDPDAARLLMERLMRNPLAPMVDTDVALLDMRGVQLENRLDRAMAKLDQAVKSGDADAIREARAEAEAAEGELGEFYEVAESVGTAAARAFRFRAIALQGDFSLGAMLRARKLAKGGEELIPAEREDVLAAHEKLKEAQAQLDAYRQKIEEQERELAMVRAHAKLLEKKAQAPPAQPKEAHQRTSWGAKNKIVTRERAKAIERELAGFFSKLNTGIDPSILPQLTEYLVFHFEAGARSLADLTRVAVSALGEAVRPHVRDLYGDVENMWRSAQRKQTIERLKTRSEKSPLTAGELGRAARALARMMVAEGVSEREALVDAVHAELRKVDPDLTRREAMDAISGYGVYRQLSTGEVEVKLRDLSGQMQQVAKLLDMQEGRAPSKTGVERRTPSDEERRLIQQVNEAKRKGGFEVDDPEAQLKTALDSIKTRMRNQIADIDAQLAAGQRTVKERTEVPLDDAAKALKAQLEDRRKTFNAVFGEEMSDEQRAELALRAVQREVADLERRVREGDLSPRQRRAAPETPALAEARARRDALRAELDYLREAAFPTVDRVETEIARLENEIETGEFQTNSKPQPAVQLTEQQAYLKNLRAQRARLLARRRREAELDRKIAEEERMIAERDFPQVTGPKVFTRSPRQQRLIDLRRQRLALDEEGADRRELLALKAHRSRQIVALRERIAQEDYIDPPSKMPAKPDAELTRLEYELENVKREFFEGVLKAKLSRRTPLEKALGGVAEVLNLGKAMKSSIDYSAPFRQGFAVTVSHPIRALRMMPEMVKAGLTEQQYFALRRAIETDSDYLLAKRSNLSLTDMGGISLAHMEEEYMSRIAGHIPVVAGSQRAYVAYLNGIRFQTFKAMVEQIRSGTGREVTMDDAELIAKYVNIATGRGTLGQKAGALAGLSTILWAPRLYLSRLQMLVGYPLWADVGGGKQNSAARKLIAKEYVRVIAGAGTLFALGILAGGEPEEVEDARSSKWMKLRVGKTYVDIWAGMQQFAVLAARVGSGKTKTGKGEIVPIRGEVPYGSDDTADVIWRFGRTKLNPSLGAAIDVLTGKNVVGEKVTPVSGAINIFTPLNPKDIYEALREEGIPKGTALGLMSTLGIGIQTYDDKPSATPPRPPRPPKPPRPKPGQ